MLEGLYAFYSKAYDIVQIFRGLNPTIIPDEFVPGSDLRGKWVIVTGGNSGIGFEAAKSFASWGASIILACRDPPSHEQHPTDAVKACQKIIQEHDHPSLVEWWEIDMADLSTVESFCQRWLDTGRVLDILCNNAGIPGTTTPTHMTKDGFQITHQINLLAPVLTTLRLLPSLRKSAEPRIICTVSAGHHKGELDFERFNGGPGLVLDYSNNKLFFQMWIAEMQSRFLKHPEYLHLTINGVNPGMVRTSIWENVKKVDSPTYKFLMWYCSISAKQGSFAITHAATNPEFGPDPQKQKVGAPDGRGGGKYINRVWEAPAKSCCEDREARLKVWALLNEELRLEEKGLLEVLGA